MNIWKRLFGGRSKPQPSASVQVTRLTRSTVEPKDEAVVPSFAPAEDTKAQGPDEHVTHMKPAPEVVIPSDAYPTDPAVVLKCKELESSLLKYWRLIFARKTFDLGERYDPKTREVAIRIKNVFRSYIYLCAEHKSAAPVYLMRALVKKYPNSAITHYGLLIALVTNLDDPRDDEVAACLEAAARLGCEYVRSDGKDGLIFSPLY